MRLTPATLLTALPAAFDDLALHCLLKTPAAPDPGAGSCDVGICSTPRWLNENTPHVSATIIMVANGLAIETRA